MTITIEQATVAFPVGARVKYYYPDMGEGAFEISIITSAPWELEGAILVQVAGKSGGVDIDRIEVDGDIPHRRDLNTIQVPTNADDMRLLLNTITIQEKMAFSNITPAMVRNKIADLRINQVPKRTVLLNIPDEEAVFYWLKNWIHPKLKHIIPRSPRSKLGCSRKVLENDQKQDSLNFYENGQHHYEYTLRDMEVYAEGGQ